jgi:hypothetical protein
VPSNYNPIEVENKIITQDAEYLYPPYGSENAKKKKYIYMINICTCA